MPLKIGSKVLLTPKTQEIINKIAPYMPQGSEVIGGFLDEGGQVFKLNYHWELLITNIDRFLKKDKSIEPVGEINSSLFAAMKSRLVAVAPPKKGYLRASSPSALPDMSGKSDIDQRYSVVSKVKVDFAQTVDKMDTSKLANAIRKQFNLCSDRIKKPGTSKHGQGYALDIQGDRKKIIEVCNQMGAKVYAEKNHLHVEFSGAVTIPSKSH